MPTYTDAEFGRITIRRSARSRSMKVSLAPDGTLRVSVPTYTPEFVVKRMVAASRRQIREIMKNHPKLYLYDGMSVGKSHTLEIQNSSRMSIKKSGLRLIFSLPEPIDLNSAAASAVVRPYIIDALRKEAKQHLPRRLQYLAQKHGFQYKSVRFSHASGRWGSCTSSGVVSLNIALMTLPFELIDYVLLHELAHTRYLNHSADFWNILALSDPDWKSHRANLKSYSPSI